MKKEDFPGINPLIGEPRTFKDFENFKTCFYRVLSKSLNTPVENILWKYKSDDIIDGICLDLENGVFTKNDNNYPLSSLSSVLENAKG